MFNGKKALVTGSTSGIGQAIAIMLAEQGADVMLNGFGDADEIEAFRSDLAARTGTDVRYHGADMSKPGEIAALMDEAGDLDILVNNAGIQHVSPVEEFPLEKWDAIIAINLSSSFHTIRAALPAMKNKGWGRIVNIASVHSQVASPFKAAYVAAKHGIAGLTKTVALECAEDGVTVNAVSPGYVWTPLVEKQIPDTAKARGITEDEVKRDVMLSAQPTKEFITVQQIADAVKYVCSDAAAGMTGHNLTIDGGWMAH